MIVYWDALAVWNFALDYLLLYGAVRLAGRSVCRRRLVLGAALGAAYSVAQLCFPLTAWSLFGAMALMCALAFGRTERFIKLTLLFVMLSCALAGAAVLLGSLSGNMDRVIRGMRYAELPWGVFFAAAGVSYLLLTFVFRGGARHAGDELVRARIRLGGRSAEVTLLRDTGNTLEDPLTGERVPVVCADAVRTLLPREETAYTLLRYRALGVPEGTLRAFRCDSLRIDGTEKGARLIALAPHALSDGAPYQGLWGERGELCESQTAVE